MRTPGTSFPGSVANFPSSFPGERNIGFLNFPNPQGCQKFKWEIALPKFLLPKRVQKEKIKTCQCSLWTTPTVLKVSKNQNGFMPRSIYSCSIGHILEHKFCHLGCWAEKENFLKRRNFCLSMLLFGVFFSCFHEQKIFFFNFFFYILGSALKSCIR